MKQTILLAFIIISLTGCQNKIEKDKNIVKPMAIKGRQGVAINNNFYITSGSKALYKYIKKGKLIDSNMKPFQKILHKVNHLGDIDCYDNKIYAGVEFFNDGKATNMQIAIYNAKTLKFIKSYSIDSTSGQKEICAVSIDPKTNTLWTADWINGSYLYKYNVQTGKYIGKLHIYPVPEKQQGLKVYNNKILITADDGDAENHEYDHLYEANITSNTSSKIKLVKTFNEVKFPGEIEGLTIDKTTKEFIILHNRGTRVVNGMPIGFYPGYNKEIHELYFYGLENILKIE